MSDYDYSVSDVNVDDPDNDTRYNINDRVDNLVINPYSGGKKRKTRKYSYKRKARKRTNRKKMKY